MAAGFHKFRNPSDAQANSHYFHECLSPFFGKSGEFLLKAPHPALWHHLDYEIYGILPTGPAQALFPVYWKELEFFKPVGETFGGFFEIGIRGGKTHSDMGITSKRFSRNHGHKSFLQETFRHFYGAEGGL